MRTRQIVAFMLAFLLFFISATPISGFARAEGDASVEEASVTNNVPQEPPATEAPKPTKPPATPAPTDAPAPTENPATPAPTDVPAPTENPATPAPTDAPTSTENPATPAPTDVPAPTENPATPAPTDAPTPTSSPEAASTPRPIGLDALVSAKRVISLGESAVWTFTCAESAQLSYCIVDAHGKAVQSGALDGQRELSFTPAHVGEYTLTLTAALDGEQRQLSDTVYASGGALKCSLSVPQSYATANVTPIAGQFSVQGGVTPYVVTVEAAAGGKRVHSSRQTVQQSGAIDISYMPTALGEYTLRVTARDASGEQVAASVRMPVAAFEHETRNDWQRLVAGLTFTGDWHVDLLTVAQTQVGYEESVRDFIIADNGKVQGYTRYGHWYGFPYDEWCAMFVMFCMEYAQIPLDKVPCSSGCRTWREKLLAVGAYEDDELVYCPQVGDLIFISRNDTNFPAHVGIVESVDDDNVYTIEGNLRCAVRRAKYKRDDSVIVGYGNLSTLMRLADAEISEQEIPAASIDAVPEGTASH